MIRGADSKEAGNKEGLQLLIGIIITNALTTKRSKKLFVQPSCPNGSNAKKGSSIGIGWKTKGDGTWTA